MGKAKTKTKTAEVTIPEEDYEELLRESALLTALIKAGVEDWEGYEVAQEYLEYEDDDEPGSEIL